MYVYCLFYYLFDMPMLLLALCNVAECYCWCDDDVDVPCFYFHSSFVELSVRESVLNVCVCFLFI